jgi:hypothetical protein
MTFDSLLDSGLGHGIDREVGRELIATNPMGRSFSYSIIEKHGLPNLKIDLG